MSSLAQRTQVAPVLKRLGREVMEAADVDALAQQLTRALAETLALREVELLLFDRKLERFESLSSAWPGRRPVKDPAGGAPATRWLLVEGVLQETPSGAEDGVLVPLMARSGLVGMLVLGAPAVARRGPPFRAAEARLLADLAARVALAVENQLYQKELIASERMAALGTMAGMLAHDFRGPMTVIRGYAELIVHRTDDEQVKSRAEAIMGMVDRMERMTRETLDFARGGGLARRLLPGPQLVAELAASVAEELPSLEIRTRIELPADTVVSSDVDKLRRVVGNIAANARDAMGGSGCLHLAARLVPGSDGAGRLELVVSDEGPGVPAELRERVFEPFVTHGKKGGTGLGLAVARRFVEDHGGALELLDHGPGAHFRIALPLPAADAGT